MQHADHQHVTRLLVNKLSVRGPETWIICINQTSEDQGPVRLKWLKCRGDVTVDSMDGLILCPPKSN